MLALLGRKLLLVLQSRVAGFGWHLHNQSAGTHWGLDHGQLVVLFPL